MEATPSSRTRALEALRSFGLNTPDARIAYSAVASAIGRKKAPSTSSSVPAERTVQAAREEYFQALFRHTDHTPVLDASTEHSVVAVQRHSSTTALGRAKADEEARACAKRMRMIMEMLGSRFESVRVCSVLGSAVSATLHKPLNGRDGGLHLSPANLEAQLEDGAYALVMLWHDDGINCHPDFLNTFWAKAPAKRGCEACLLPERDRELEGACLRSMTRSDDDESMRATSAELPAEATKPFASFVPPRDAPPNPMSGPSTIPAGTGISASSRTAMMRGALFEGSRRDDEKKKADERVGKLNASYESAKQAATNSAELAFLATQRENDLTLQLQQAEQRVTELREQLASATLHSNETRRVAAARATAAAQSHSELQAAIEQQRLFRLAFEFAKGETDDMAWAVNRPNTDYALVADMLARMPFVTDENETNDVNDKGKAKEVEGDELGGTVP